MFERNPEALLKSTQTMSAAPPSPSKSPLSYMAVRQGRRDFPSINLRLVLRVFRSGSQDYVLRHLPGDQGQADQPLVPQIFPFLEYRSAVRKQCCRNKIPFFHEQFICSSSMFL